MSNSSVHITLLGDSIFDNAAYTSGAPDVITHLAAELGAAGQATLLAVDGAVASEIQEQLMHVPTGSSHLVVSVGGNDALQCLDLFERKVETASEAFTLLGEAVTRFEIAYRLAVREVIAVGPPVTLCTIYNGNFPSPLDAVTRVALTPFNDVILRVAFERGLNVIDLRLVCNEASDYANPIEPSGSGGAKIARAIARSCGVASDGLRTSMVSAN